MLERSLKRTFMGHPLKLRLHSCNDRVTAVIPYPHKYQSCLTREIQKQGNLIKNLAFLSISPHVSHYKREFKLKDDLKLIELFYVGSSYHLRQQYATVEERREMQGLGKLVLLSTLQWMEVQGQLNQKTHLILQASSGSIDRNIQLEVDRKMPDELLNLVLEQRPTLYPELSMAPLNSLRKQLAQLLSHQKLVDYYHSYGFQVVGSWGLTCVTMMVPWKDFIFDHKTMRTPASL